MPPGKSTFAIEETEEAASRPLAASWTFKRPRRKMGHIYLVRGRDSSLEPVEYRVDRRLENEVSCHTTGDHGIAISIP